MEKLKKKIIGIVVIMVVICSSVVYYQYHSLVLETQSLYHQIELPKTTEQYKKDELFDYNNLLDVKELAFDKLDTKTLAALQESFVNLDTLVQQRMVGEYFEQIRKAVDDLKVDNARAGEADTFNTQKQVLLDIVNRKTELQVEETIPEGERLVYKTQYQLTKKALDKEMEKLKEIQLEVQKRINDRIADEQAQLEAAQQQNSGNNAYWSDDYTSAPSYQVPSGSYTPPSIPNPPSSEEVCTMLPDGSSWCVGGDW